MHVNLRAQDSEIPSDTRQAAQAGVYAKCMKPLDDEKLVALVEHIRRAQQARLMRLESLHTYR